MLDEVRHERENLYHSLALAAAGATWLAVLFFFPLFFPLVVFFAVILAGWHLSLARKGARAAWGGRLVAGVEDVISSEVSALADRFNLPAPPLFLVEDRGIVRVFKHLFPHSLYVLLPPDPVLSPFDEGSGKTARRIVREGMAHFALARMGPLQETFLLAARPLPFFYAAYRRVLALGADRVLLLLDRESEQTGQPSVTAAYRDGFHTTPCEEVWATGRGHAYRLLRPVRRGIAFLYGCHPVPAQRAQEIRKYEVRLQRKERMAPNLVEKKFAPGAEKEKARPVLLIGKRRKARASMLGPLGLAVSITAIVAVVLAVSLTAKNMRNLHMLPSGRDMGKAPIDLGKPVQDGIKAPSVPVEVEPDAGKEKEAARVPPGRNLKRQQKDTTEKRDRPGKEDLAARRSTESWVNAILRRGGHEGIKAVVARDGTVILMGSTFSVERKQRAFRRVRDMTGNQKIRDLVYVVEE